MATSALFAQTALYVAQNDDALLVRDVHRSTPLVQQGGEVVPVSGDRFILKKTTGYPPILVAVRDMVVSGMAHQTNGGSTVNGQFYFSAEFEALQRLDRVFLVLEFREPGKDPVLFIWGVGTLMPHVPQTVDAMLPLKFYLTGRTTKLHVYTDGREVLHTQLPSREREYMLDAMVAERIKDTANEGPSVLAAVPAAYPKSIWPRKDGTAVLAIRVAPNGAVIETQVKSASDPAFGIAAGQAVAFWRFLPLIEHGQRLESKVTMPFVFRANPPAPAAVSVLH